MANVVPLVVSGEVGPTQKSILMTIVNNQPYYLVSDLDKTPYFQPLYQDVGTGLAVFNQFATRVIVNIASRGRAGETAMKISESDTSRQFVVDPSTKRIIAPASSAETLSFLKSWCLGIIRLD
jgi:hypothetical protein